ncbi:MAG: DUF2207 domain-containing protein [Caldisericia bacterium]|nr:DUF2207 domain-containing protein [Caldisericia bacterium]
MKRAGWILLVVVLFLPCLCDAKSFNVTQTELNCLIRQNGNIDWKEANTFQFEGQFSRASIGLIFRNDTYLDNIVIGENGIPYKHAYSGKENTYWIGEEGVLNYYFNAQNETRTFEISYTIFGAIEAFADYSDFYWPIHLKTWSDPLESFKATFRLEKPIPKDELHVWFHGPMRGHLTIIDEQTITLEINNVTPEEVMDIRILIPSTYFTIEKSDQEVGSTIITEETNRAVEEKKQYELGIRKQKQRMIRDWIFGVGFLLLGVFLLCYLLYLLTQYGIEYRLPRRTHSIQQPLELLPPGETAYLMKFFKYPILAIQAIILDLIRKKILRLSKYPAENQRNDELLFILDTKEQTEPIRDYEATLLYEILFPPFAEKSGTGISVSKLRKTLQENPKQFIPAVQKFKSQLKEAVNKQSFFDISKQKVSDWIISVCMTVLAVFIWIKLIYPRRFLYAIPVFIILFEFIGWMNLTRRTKTGTLYFKQYLQFRKFLKNPEEIKAMGDEDESEATWEKYLVYSVALEASKKTIPVMSEYLNLMENIGSTLMVQLSADWSSSFKQILASSYSAASIISRYPSAWLNLREKVGSSKLFSRIFIRGNNIEKMEVTNNEDLL